MTAQHPALEGLCVGREGTWASPVLLALPMHRLILCTSLAYLPLPICSADEKNVSRDKQWLPMLTVIARRKPKKFPDSCYERINYRYGSRPVASIMASFPLPVGRVDIMSIFL